eukprot:CAMPEP_0197037086 /NCGR_PEP_ID=MMETSP1384-20130603/14386_1 /TAXON_ID=29189 /ORGANISM="Ammonia sp." /LENGTH=226 /DNA_ID=CAMNT_0042467343 /DNA_START=17 /DNA_END=693 /DNA_ORIENTATION=+
MYAADDGSTEPIKISHRSAGITPGGGLVGIGDGGPKWSTTPTPLSPSTTEEISANSNNALPSTVNDEIFAWLIHSKVDDQRIGNYLCAREITLDELATFSDQELDDLLKDIAEENKSSIQMIYKNRFIRACKALRPHQHQHSLSHQQPPHQHPQTAVTGHIISPPRLSSHGYVSPHDMSQQIVYPPPPPTQSPIIRSYGHSVNDMMLHQIQPLQLINGGSSHHHDP